MTPGIQGLLWRRFTWRHWREQLGQSLLLVLILALGVAVYFSIRLANRAAAASFQHFTDLVTAESDWIIQAPAGDLPESVLDELRVGLGNDPVHVVPIVESTATRPPNGSPETIGSRLTFRVLGIDLVGIQNVAREARTSAALGSRAEAKSPTWFGQRSAIQAGRGADGSVAAGSNRATAGEPDLWRVLRDPRSVFVSAELARREGLQVGSELPMVLNERIVPLRVAGVIPDQRGQPTAPVSLLVMDLPALQHWTGREGTLTRVEFRVGSGPDEDRRRAGLRQRLEDWGRAGTPAISGPARAGAGGADETSRASGASGASGASANLGTQLAGSSGTAVESSRWWVQSPSERRAAGAAMTRAFRLNLTILSLLALMVGLYLIVQALDGAVVRRRGEIGVLRSLGVEASAIYRAWLVEALVLGVVGGVVGAGLGALAAQISVRWVGMTVNALYYASSAETATLSLGEWWGALGLSVAASVLAAWWPARAAARTPPAQLLGRDITRAAPVAWDRLHPLIGVLMAGAGWLCALLPPLRFEGGARFPAGGYAAALLWILAGGLLGRAGLAGLARVLGPLGAWTVIGRLAFSPLRRPSGRHALATAGLICAVAMTAGMIILVGSFDQTMRGWVGRTFQADLYVSSSGAQSASTDNRLSPSTWQALIRHPAVIDANVLQACEVRLPGGTTILAGGDLGFMRRQMSLSWVQPPVDGEAVFERATGSDEGLTPVLVSESFSERFRLGRGDRVALPTPSGVQPLRIDGVFADYGNERGSIVIDRGHYVRWFRTEFAASVIVRLRQSEATESVRAEWLAAFPGLQILSQSHLRAEILRIFRQTFAITYALEAIGLTVAVLGLAMTLASVLIERRPDWTTLRALGLRPGELARVAAVEGLLVAGAGLVVGLGVSFALGWLLIRVINKQTFGWTLEMAAPWGSLLLLVLMVLAGAGVVSYAVGRWGANLPADREE